jgi:hypothetical protein
LHVTNLVIDKTPTRSSHNLNLLLPAGPQKVRGKGVGGGGGGGGVDDRLINRSVHTAHTRLKGGYGMPLGAHTLLVEYVEKT